MPKKEYDHKEWMDLTPKVFVLTRDELLKYMTDWEQKFIKSVGPRVGQLSDKQKTHLLKIIAKYLR